MKIKSQIKHLISFFFFVSDHYTQTLDYKWMPRPCLSNFSYSELESGKEKNLSDLSNYAS